MFEFWLTRDGNALATALSLLATDADIQKPQLPRAAHGLCSVNSPVIHATGLIAAAGFGRPAISVPPITTAVVTVAVPCGPSESAAPGVGGRGHRTCVAGMNIVVVIVGDGYTPRCNAYAALESLRLERREEEHVGVGGSLRRRCAPRHCR